MKHKIVSIILSGMLLINLCACGSSSEPISYSDMNQENSINNISTPQPKGYNVGVKKIIPAFSKSFKNATQSFEFGEDGLYMIDGENRQLLYSLNFGGWNRDYAHGLCYGDYIYFSCVDGGEGSSMVKVYKFNPNTLTKETVTTGYVHQLYLYNDKLIVSFDTGINEYDLINDTYKSLASKSDFNYSSEITKYDVTVGLSKNELWILERNQDGKIFSLSLDTGEIKWTGYSLPIKYSSSTMYWYISETDNCIYYYDRYNVKYKMDLSSKEIIICE